MSAATSRSWAVGSAGIARLALHLAAVMVLTWALLDHRFRDGEGTLTAGVCLPIAVGCGLLIVAWAAGSSTRAFALWLSLALVGQAGALQIIDAGNLVRWQHYRSLDPSLLETEPVVLLILCGQAGLVAVGIGRRWLAIRGWTVRHFRVWQLLAAGTVFALLSAAPHRDLSLYLQNLLVATALQAVNLGNIVLAVGALPRERLKGFRRAISRLPAGKEGDVRSEFDAPPWGDGDTPATRRQDGGGPTDHPARKKVDGPISGLEGGRDRGAFARGDARSRGLDGFAVVAAGWVFALAAGAALLTYQAHPHITDEVAYLYQARFFAEGAIRLPAPPVPEAFDIYLMEVKGEYWYPATPPGWPAILAVGVRLGVPWLVNPLLAGANTLLVYLLMRALYDLRTARLVLLLLCTSPWFLFMGMNFMTHTFTLTCALSAALSVIRARQTGQARWALVAGMAVGVATLIRPLDGLIVGALTGMWALGLGGRRLSIPALLAFGVGGALTAALVLPYNWALSGNPMVFPLNAYLDGHFGPGHNDLGFGPNRGYGWPTQPFPGHSPLGGLVNAALNGFSVNVELLGWSIGSLLPATLLVLSGSLRKSDYLMIAVCMAIFWPYFFYYYSGGPDFGARYWYLMIVPLVALTVRGIGWLQGTLEHGTTGSPLHGTRVLAAVLILSALTLLNYFPWRALDKYHNFWGMRPDVVSLAKEYRLGRSLVLIHGAESHPDFASAAIYNPLHWDADAPVYAWDKNATVRAQLLKAFPDRPVWIIEAPSVTHAGYRVAAGPMPATDLLARGYFDEKATP